MKPLQDTDLLYTVLYDTQWIHGYMYFCIRHHDSYVLEPANRFVPSKKKVVPKVFEASGWGRMQ